MYLKISYVLFLCENASQTVVLKKASPVIVERTLTHLLEVQNKVINIKLFVINLLTCNV